MAKAPTHGAAHLRHLFHGETPDWHKSDALYVSLHTADPTDSNAQDANEVAYAGYARIRVSRNAMNEDAFVMNDGVASNPALMVFPPSKSDAEITHFGIGTKPDGKGRLLYAGALHSPLKIGPGIAPAFPAGAIQIRED